EQRDGVAPQLGLLHQLERPLAGVGPDHAVLLAVVPPQVARDGREDRGVVVDGDDQGLGYRLLHAHPALASAGRPGSPRTEGAQGPPRVASMAAASASAAASSRPWPRRLRASSRRALATYGRMPRSRNQARAPARCPAASSKRPRSSRAFARRWAAVQRP